MGIKWTNSNKIVPLSKKNVCCQTAEMRENLKKYYVKIMVLKLNSRKRNGILSRW